MFIKILLDQFSAEPQYKKEQIEQMAKNIRSLRPISGITSNEEASLLYMHCILKLLSLLCNNASDCLIISSHAHHHPKGRFDHGRVFSLSCQLKREIDHLPNA